MDKSQIVGLLPLDPRTDNFGCQLQQYALYRVINEMGLKCEIIDEPYCGENSLFSVHYSWKNITLEWFANKVKSKLKKSTPISEERKDAVKRKREKFKQFRKKHLVFSEACTIKTINNIAAKYRYLVCGSDQIWNPQFSSPNYYLNFANENQRTIIYAASIGREFFTKRERTVIRPYLKKLDYISVREKSGQKLIKNIVPEKNIELVLDPALMLTQDKWERILPSERIVKEPYVFLHIMGTNEGAEQSVKHFTEDKNLKLVSIGNPAEENFRDAGPDEFLRLIRDAEYVITDSFHATAFSLLFHKEVYCLGRVMSGHSMNARISTILETCNISNRMGSIEMMTDVFHQNINYEEVDQLLADARENSLAFLKKGLDQDI